MWSHKKLSLSNRPVLKMRQIYYTIRFSEQVSFTASSSSLTKPCFTPPQEPTHLYRPFREGWIPLSPKRWVPSSEKNHRRLKLPASDFFLNRTSEKHSLVLKNTARGRRMEYRLKNSVSKLIIVEAGWWTHGDLLHDCLPLCKKKWPLLFHWIFGHT